MPVLEGLENDGDEIEDALFQETGAGDRTLSRRTYELLNQVADFQRAVQTARYDARAHHAADS